MESQAHTAQPLFDDWIKWEGFRGGARWVASLSEVECGDFPTFSGGGGCAMLKITPQNRR